MSTQFTFWKLLTDFEVVIPMIQRDYAQGRNDTRIKQIRDSFVETLCRVFTCDENIVVDLDFIYGSSSSGKLVLLDGQQRMTTLFLLHWYVAIQSSELTDDVKHILSKFSYETRASSREFCASLISESIAAVSKNESLSEQIKDAQWFHADWKKDPTVQSMLIMLDAIHSALKDGQVNNVFWQRLTDDVRKAISFHFLNMGDFHLTDELYIKMNARGKLLSDFENFKAWLQGYVERNGWEFADEEESDWKHRMDKEWTDFFWKNRGYKPEIDTSFLKFFKSVGMFSLAEKMSIASERLSEEDSQRIKRFNDDDYISSIEYENWSCFNSITLKACFCVLDHLCGEGDHVTQFRNLVSPNNYTDRALAYAYFIFVAEEPLIDPRDNDSRNLKAWLRITGNLVLNTNIDDPVSFVRSVQSLFALWSKVKEKRADFADWVLNAFVAMTNNDITFFSLDQRREEIKKANLILQDSGWQERLINIEKHPYFLGQIGFLIEYSVHDSQYDKDLFDQYAAKASALFDIKLLKTSEHLVERALLTKGNYLITVASGYSNRGFCKPDSGTLRSREENWRQVFKTPVRNQYVKQLLDSIKIGEEENGLCRIINDEKVTIGEDWRKLLVECPEAISYCGQKQIRWEDNGAQVYLLTKTRTSGYYAELRTYHFWNRVLKPKASTGELSPFNAVHYYHVSGMDDSPSICLNSCHIGDMEFSLGITYNRNSYKLRLSATDNRQIPSALKERLLKQGFVALENVNFINKDVSKGELEETLQQLIFQLRDPT